MGWEEEARAEWKKRIGLKTKQVVEGYNNRSDGEVDLAEALVGVFAEHNCKKEIPRVVVRDSEGKTENGLIRVFDKIIGVMKTPTYDTINRSNPKAVRLVEELCVSNSITGGYAERDASYVLWEMVGERPVVY